MNAIVTVMAALLLAVSLPLAPSAGPAEDVNAALQRGDYQAAVPLLRELADAGSPEAQHNLARAYREGRGVPQDFEQAVKWYERAAEQGLLVSQNTLGFMYFEGGEVARDHAKAAKWYRMAAEQGAAAAQINLGWQYSSGNGVPQDLSLIHI